MNAKTLMPVRYVDLKQGISLEVYADTAVYDSTGGQKYLCAIRFGGYPEQVDAMSNAISGGGAIEVSHDGEPLMLKSHTKGYCRKISHDGVYAECTMLAEDDKQQGHRSPAHENGTKPPQTTDLPPCNSYIYVRPGDRAALFDAIDQKTAVPLSPDFAEYMLNTLQKENILIPLKTLSADPLFEAWILKASDGDRNIIKVVENGLKSGAIRIPGAANAGAYFSFNGIKNITQYLTRYGSAIAQRIKNLFVPLFDPAKDALSPEVLAINQHITQKAGYSLYDAQLAVAEAVKRQLERRKIGLIIADCGAGKTKIGTTAIAAAVAGLHLNQQHRRRKKTFNIVLCPAHITKKWVREIEESLPDTFAAVVRSISDLDRLYSIFAKGDKNCYAILSKENARDGYMYTPAVLWNRRKKTFVCPDCGEIIEMQICQDGSQYRDNADQFFFKRQNRENHKCEHCGSPLWTALNPRTPQAWVKINDYGFVYKEQVQQHYSKTANPGVVDKLSKIEQGTYHTKGAHRRFPLSTYIKRHYKGRIDGLIVDEVHHYNNDSGQGDAMAELFDVARKVVGMTATLINGYSSGIFYLLYRIMPGLLLQDGKSYTRPTDFISEYGVVENVYEIDEGDYSSNRRTVKRKKGARQLPGVSPLVYSRFLLEYAAFLSLSDMGKDLPEYEEIPVPIELPPTYMRAYRHMQDTLISFMKSDHKAARRILSSYLNLLTAYPDQPYGQPTIVHPKEGYDIVSPPDLATIDTLMPKDKAALDIVSRKIAAGERVMIYTNWIRLDTQEKLLRRMTEAGYRTAILPVSVKPSMREEWVEARLGEGLQILITNPHLVETGLDLNAFTTLIFYDTGYKLFTLRQASRRSLRINQTAPRIEVYLLYYTDTLQHKAMKLMASKLAVAAIIEGGFSEEGLAAMSQCDDMTTLMAKELMLGIKDNVEDVSAAFKRMAFRKSSIDSGLLTFAREPITLLPATTAIEPVAFTFSPKSPVSRASKPVALPLVCMAEGSGQMSLFDEIA